MTKKTIFALLVITVFAILVGGIFFSYGRVNPAFINAELNTNCGIGESQMIYIKGGDFLLGAKGVYGDEFPEIPTKVQDFFMSKYEVTNKEFSDFVSDTGYVTVAEKIPEEGLYPGIDPAFLVPGSSVFKGMSEAFRSGEIDNWWQFVPGANWKHPNGPESNIEGLDFYPVVHIALADAQAFAKWKGHRLPTEAEHEFASRGGLINKKYAAGDKLVLEKSHKANTWQGVFPFSNSADDGHVGVAPVGCYDANQYGINDLIGNVWEWTSNAYYPNHNINSSIVGNALKNGYDPKQPNVPVGVIKGGSYLCSDDFCARFRPAGRHPQDVNLGASHLGFRTVMDAPNQSI
ncbi:formylglycine-generating enzyme family protein [Alteromonas sp. 5E99-2]|uniref:formylglycine-generating enzyme family protein n=1 Tax=Alteromonas sp. 5E99-2 TaxID=2817683 RepID=UPI001A98C8A7|nr:formylglycine-generating enzyme family protein [Alteromonas sp. 5E99-2]MBO1257006.1 formylglycine-generating enzyme family protein [Alteromonas sp. 5E99-2]